MGEGKLIRKCGKQNKSSKATFKVKPVITWLLIGLEELMDMLLTPLIGMTSTCL